MSQLWAATLLLLLCAGFFTAAPAGRGDAPHGVDDASDASSQLQIAAREWSPAQPARTGSEAGGSAGRLRAGLEAAVQATVRDLAGGDGEVGSEPLSAAAVERVARNVAARLDALRPGVAIEPSKKPEAPVPLSVPPKMVLIFPRTGRADIVKAMVVWLQARGVQTFFEADGLRRDPELGEALADLEVGKLESPEELTGRRLDLVITLGGDGTILHSAAIFGADMPPVISFAAGSLSFLAPFRVDHWEATLARLLAPSHAPLQLVHRTRLRVSARCSSRHATGGVELKETREALALNEVAVQRHSPGMATLEIAVDSGNSTLLQGDGVLVATPTGSTAYSLSAGGSMVNPEVSAILLTPLAPHSLSFRPAILPESSVVSVRVPTTARQGVGLSVDGYEICSLGLGDSLTVSVSPYSVPTVVHTTGTADWLSAVQNGMQWNAGVVEQKAL